MPYAPFPNVPARNGLQAMLEVPALVRALNLPMGMRVLEVGCGRGIALPVLRHLLRPARLVGLDIDPALVAEARASVPADIAIIHGDVRALPFADDSFDIVIDFGTCYHIAEPVVALNEVSRVLGPRGLFVHETPVSQHLAHPVRSFARRLPWSEVPALGPSRTAVLWSARRKLASPTTRRPRPVFMAVVR